MTAGDYTVRRQGAHALITMPAEIDVTNADEIRQALLGATSQDAAACTERWILARNQA
jgi:hypothetical protein